MHDQQLLNTLALLRVSKIGAITAKKLIAKCGSSEAVLSEKKQSLMKIDGIGQFLAESILNPLNRIEAEAELKFLKENKIKSLYFQDYDYPERLKHCIDAPILLFQRGAIKIQDKPIISIVGTRKITSKGIAFCEKLVDELSFFNPVIVSGFAYGTDITAQKAALKNNLQTIGCLAHGFNQIYPKVHEKYMSDIEKHGGFFTEFWSTDAFDRNNFLKRNRIIAGLSEAVIVIESAEKGGSLVTADIANSYHRDVFAVPGRITDTQSIGCNNLIKYKNAHLLSDPMDIPYLLNWKLKPECKKTVQKQLFMELSQEEKKIYNYLKANGKSLLDVIAIACDLPGSKVASILLELELKDVIKPLPGKWFELV